MRRVTWTVHLANRKGVARRLYHSGPGCRNRATGDDLADRALIIDPGPRSVDLPGQRRSFDSGCFRSTVVPLGEMFLEPRGRLVVLGGYGSSGSDPRQVRLDPDRGHRADNSDWYDDTSDGPVTATIELGDGTTAESFAWVIVGPPDYAPGIINQVSLYDRIFDVAADRGLMARPTDPGCRVSFTHHVLPILARAMDYRWVSRAANHGSAGEGSGHGPGGRGDFSTKWGALSDPSPASERLRKSMSDRLRDPDATMPNSEIATFLLIPRLTDTQSRRSGPGNVLPLTRTQYRIMQAWGRGDFEGDYGRATPLREGLADALDRLALQSCVGGALDPGIEANGVILAAPSSYVEGEPFRLSSEVVRPGGVTESNAVPWQADYISCRWQENDGPWPMRLGWWPAQRPDEVYPEVGAEEMVSWARGLKAGYQDMIEHWDRLGMVVDRGTPEAPFFAEEGRDTRVLGP